MYPESGKRVITIETMREKWDLTQILTSISEQLHSSADPVKARGMSGYMRNQFEFLGIATPLRRNTVNNTLKRYSDPSEPEVIELARALHKLPEREFQHAGVDALLYHRKLIGPAFIGEPAEFFVTHKSWWDSVDALNPLIRRLVQTHAECVPVMHEWITSENRWIARSAITHQLTLKEHTDTERLAQFCSLRARDTEFFIAKAIGWALRDYSHSHPQWVQHFVDTHPQLSPLARREALKVIVRKSRSR
jgi:3-methyladenine DNA glycosylase AlkD